MLFLGKLGNFNFFGILFVSYILYTGYAFYKSIKNNTRRSPYDLDLKVSWFIIIFLNLKPIFMEDLEC
jgi:hypothetical protein